MFCVSNKAYDKHSRKGNASLVVASGIPELRRFCHSITAEAQLREARHFLQSTLFSFLNSLEMWAQSAVAPPREAGTRPEEAARVVAREIERAVSDTDVNPITTLGLTLLYARPQPGTMT